MTLEDLAKLFALMEAHQIDRVVVDGVTVEKSRHEMRASQQPAQGQHDDDEDEEVFPSTSVSLRGLLR